MSAKWSELVHGFSLNENGIKGLKRLKRKFELDEIMTAMQIATEQYLEYSRGAPTKKSVEAAWNKVGGICTIRRREKTHPGEQRLYYVLGILRNRLNYVNEALALKLLRDALTANASLESLEAHAKSVGSWTAWRNGIEEFIDEQRPSLGGDGAVPSEDGPVNTGS